MVIMVAGVDAGALPVRSRVFACRSHKGEESDEAAHQVMDVDAGYKPWEPKSWRLSKDR